MVDRKKVEVDRLDVIPLETGKWAVPSSKGDGTTYTVELEGESLKCNCLAGLRGAFCKHKKAVELVAEHKQLAAERDLAAEGKEKPMPEKTNKELKRTVSGYDFGEVASALQKSIRRSDERETVYWALELYKTAPHYVVKRLLVIASEDVGLADPHVVGVVNSLAVGWSEAKKFSWYVSPHQVIMMAMLLARADKSTEVEDLRAVIELDVKEGKRRKIPEDAIDMHTSIGKARDKAAGKSYDDQCRDWYQSRLAAGIPMNKYTEELKARCPQWFVDPRLPEFFEEGERE